MQKRWQKHHQSLVSLNLNFKSFKLNDSSTELRKKRYERENVALSASERAKCLGKGRIASTVLAKRRNPAGNFGREWEKIRF